MKSNYLTAFLQEVEKAFTQNQVVQIRIFHPVAKNAEVKKIVAKPVIIKAGTMISFVFSYATKDITKNYNALEALQLIDKLLMEEFNEAELKTSTTIFTLIHAGSAHAKMKKQALTSEAVISSQHDHAKHRLIETHNNTYLKALGILDDQFRVKPSMQDKYKQINKYVEIVDALLKEYTPPKMFNVVDMGAGKGYLTFALYDHLRHTKKWKLQVSGIEYRNDLVALCNTIATHAGFEALTFKQGSIKDADITNVSMLIALHACDTATDDAIYKGITAGAAIIICSPCCHKQVRNAMQPTGPLKDITQFGILKERQAEIVTDTIRALLLEAFGYKTNVMEFISTEHTPKNLLITAVKRKHTDKPDANVIDTIQALKEVVGLDRHYLESLLLK